MGMTLRIAGIQEDSIVDGPGFRLAVFTQGCPHHCPGCHNPQTHPFDGGEFIDTDELLEKLSRNRLAKGITFSGGEPFCQPEPLAHLARQVHSIGKDVVCFTGFTLEQLQKMDDPHVHELLGLVDILIDGPYVEAERDLTLKFRGSANQRVIDLPETLKRGGICLWHDPYDDI
ncbi:MAG: anaerobic ribonucleoside-triphosphate reductase activating protein [Ruminococcaceae bacterium]|nr:anaerobic ribonucleoside-triphosphate reductase activating protein [Oscillospiraceae bacterium]